MIFFGLLFPLTAVLCFIRQFRSGAFSMLNLTCVRNMCCVKGECVDVNVNVYVFV